MDRSGAGCVYVCVCVRNPASCVSDYYTAIISGLSLSLSLCLNPSSIHLSRSLVKDSAPNKAHSHAERMRGSTEWFQTHTTITYGFSLTVSSTLLYILSPTLFLPKTSSLCFSTLCITRPCLPTSISTSDTICLSLSLSCGGQLEPYVSFSAQRPLV